MPSILERFNNHRKSRHNRKKTIQGTNILFTYSPPSHTNNFSQGITSLEIPTMSSLFTYPYQTHSFNFINKPKPESKHMAHLLFTLTDTSHTHYLSQGTTNQVIPAASSLFTDQLEKINPHTHSLQLQNSTN